MNTPTVNVVVATSFSFACEDYMPHSSTSVFDAGTSGNLDAAKAACRRRAVVQRAKLADALPDAATMLAGHAARLTSRYGFGVFAGYMPPSVLER